MKTAKFFEYGEVSLLAFDESTRQAAIQMVMPCCLMQTITPALLGGGHIDQYELRNPVAIWMPSIDSDKYKPELLQQYPDIPTQVNATVKKKLEEVLDLFKELSGAIKDPTNFIPMLPMGVYIQFRLRCEVDNMAQVLLNLENTLVVGVAEFRFALAEILAEVLKDL